MAHFGSRRKKVAKGIGELVGAESLHRLRQLELQGQGVGLTFALKSLSSSKWMQIKFNS